jgi:hypothetical protein
MRSRKRRTRTVSRSGNSVGSGASMQEGNTLKAIRLTQLQACPKKKKIVPKLFEQNMYRIFGRILLTLLVSITCSFSQLFSLQRL